MKVLIVDDEPLAREELSYLLSQNINVEQIDEADSIEEAENQMQKQVFDIIFLDIRLGDDNGFELAQRIRKISSRPRIIFATAYSEYAVDAFEVNAIDYVLKPFEQSRIDQAINKYLNTYNQTPKTINKTRLSLTFDDKTNIIQQKDIIYIYVEQGILNAVTNSQTFKSKSPLSHIIKLLDTNLFLQTHRNYVVNINKIIQSEPSFNNTYQLKLSNGDKVPVARSYVNIMKNILNM